MLRLMTDARCRAADLLIGSFSLHDGGSCRRRLDSAWAALFASSSVRLLPALMTWGSMRCKKAIAVHGYNILLFASATHNRIIPSLMDLSGHGSPVRMDEVKNG